VFRDGDQAMMCDSRGRRYLIVLRSGQEFHSHAGYIPHDSIIGQPEGTWLRSTTDARFLALRPTLIDYVLKMPRGAQVIYPKDLGPILLQADLYPGARVFESGLGSGALSTAVLRTGAIITGYEIREEFERHARENVAAFLGAEALERYDTHIADAYAGIHHDGFDRILLDLPEPWQVAPHCRTALRPGAILVAYNPSIVQVMRLREVLEREPFGAVESMEVLQRTWHVDGFAVRPDHRMVAHTGFITTARFLG
jgi:tRNA (adenine57-N1/adenine58-N1)-methyltransferase